MTRKLLVKEGGHSSSCRVKPTFTKTEGASSVQEGSWPSSGSSMVEEGGWPFVQSRRVSRKSREGFFGFCSSGVRKKMNCGLVMGNF